MSKPITCTREGGEIVIRVPDGSPRVLVAVEGLSGVWPTGWIVADGATAGIQPAVLYRPSEQPTLTQAVEMPLARELAALCADLFMLAGTRITAPLPELMVIAHGNQVQIGLCGAAVALRELLKRDELGSVALRDLVHKPGFDDVQGK